jgi:cytochrome c556
MTIRAAMATEIMAAIVGGCERGEQHDPRSHRDHAAKDAVRYVDALIAALNEEKP